MRMMKSLFSFIILLAFFGCSTSSELKLTIQSFYPLRVGNYQIYNVSETTILHLTCNETGQTISTYQLKVVVNDSLKNIEGGYTYSLHRYSRIDSTQAWAIADTWTSRINNNQLVNNESNINYVKFIYPLTSTSTWNGNLYNDIGEEDYTVKALAQPYTALSGKQFSNTFTVVQKDDQNLVNQDTRIEVYGQSVGVIYKSTTQLVYFTDAACFGQKVVKNGIIYTQSLISYGHQ